MSISSTTRTSPIYTGNGTATVFPFSFKVFQASDVMVVKATNGVETTLVLGTDYTVSLNANQDAQAGGSVTLLAAPQSTDSLVITSNVQPLQSVTLGGTFYPQTLNDMFDKLTILVQQLSDKVGRAVTATVTSGISPSALLSSILSAQTSSASSASAASTSATNAANSATSAANSATQASGYAASINPANLVTFSTYTAADVLSKIKSVGGSGSGLDADLLDGLHAVDIVKQSNIGFKNYIINGNFDIWQRGTSQTTDGYGSDDRWANFNWGSTKTHSRVACTDTERALFNAQAFSRTVVTSVTGVNSNATKAQSIEDVTKLAGKTVTLSFWARADSNKNIAVEFRQRFGTGGSPSAEVQSIGSQLVSLTTTWQKKTVTVTLPSIVGKTLGTDGVHTSSTALVFWFDAGSNFNSLAANLGQQSGTFDIAQVQLEEGSVATPFEQRPVGLELSLCQRYYEVVNVILEGYTNTNFWGNEYKFATNKRVAPTITSIVTPHFSNIASNLYYINNELVARGDAWIARDFRSSIYVGVNATSINGFQRFSTVLAASAEL